MAKSKWDLVRSRFYDIEKWLENGLSEAQIIKNIGIGKTAWESYKKKYPELCELIKKGRQTQITEVENSLFKSATGYAYHVDEIVKTKIPGGGEEFHVVSIQKYKPPEVAAMIFFLKNKDKENWCDNPQMIKLKKEELALRIKEIENKAW